MKVRNILATKSSRVHTIEQGQTVRAAVTLLNTHSIGALPVVTPDNVPVGMISERDIIRELDKRDAALLELPVDDIMTHKQDLVIAETDDDLDYLSNAMTHKRVRHLLVLETGRLIGIISIGDVVHARMTHYEGEIHTLQHHLDHIYAIPSTE